MGELENHSSHVIFLAPLNFRPASATGSDHDHHQPFGFKIERLGVVSSEKDAAVLWQVAIAIHT